MDKSSRQKINKATEILNDRLEQLDLIDIFRTFSSVAQTLVNTVNFVVICIFLMEKILEVAY